VSKTFRSPAIRHSFDLTGEVVVRATSDLPNPVTSDVSRCIDQTGNNGALNALFARTSRKSEVVICPINETALEESNPSPSFYCVHALSGAGGSDFCDLAKLMPEVRFYGIQAPPKRIQDPEFGRSVESIADYYANALMKFQPNGPFLLGGWSAGAIIGLQIAQNLRARGREVSLLVAFDGAPENTAAGLRPWHPLYLLELTGNVRGWIVHEQLLKKGAFRSLIQRALIKAMALPKSRTARENADEIQRHAVDGFMDLSRYPPDQRSFMRRLHDALMAYKPQEYHGKVMVYEAKVKPLFHLPQVGKIWSKLAPQSVIAHVNGTHLSVVRDPYAEAIAADLRSRIAQIVEPPPRDRRRSGHSCSGEVSCLAAPA
jgi:thioesterase domain-containing protein